MNENNNSLSRKTAETLQKEISPSQKLKDFLNYCDDSYGNIFELKEKTKDGTEFLGHGRLDDGTPIRIIGYLKKTANGSNTMPIRIVRVPESILGNPDMEWLSEETKSFLKNKKI